MLSVLVACFALATSVSATAFTDLNCTNGDATTSAFLASATACDDNYSGAACTALFGVAAAGGGTTDRDALCLTTPEVKEIAIANCPKHCGYCCMTPEFKCTNKDFPRVRCSTITPPQCRDPTWRTIIAEDCPNVCGFCLQGGCVDTTIECENDPAICRNVDMQPFVRLPAERALALIRALGRNLDSCLFLVPQHGSIFYSCATWIRNGFCTSAFYTAAQKISYCGRSCNLC
ncbi:shTK domain protein [Ostertagia ostertagi]